MKISFDPNLLSDWTLLKGPEDWTQLIEDQRRINGNKILHSCGVEPLASDYPCLAIIDGIRESGWGSDQLDITFIPHVEVTEDDEDDSED